MGYIINRLVNYADRNIELSRFELAKLKYMLEVVFWNAAELILFILVFLYLGKIVEFFISFGVLMSIRLFAGGFHLKSMYHCAIVSLAALMAIIIFLPLIDISNGLMDALLLSSILITAILAPINKRLKRHSPKVKYRFKFISTAAVITYTILLLSNRTIPYADIITWTIFIQSFQLIIAKMIEICEKKISLNA